MRRLFPGFLFAVICAVAILSLPATAKVAVSASESGSIDVGYYMSKIEKIFFTGEFAEKHPEAAHVKFFLDKLGVLALNNYSCNFVLADGKLHEDLTLTLDPEKQTGLLGKLLQLPDRTVKIGQILNPGSTLASVSIMNPAEKMEIMWGALSDQELWQELSSIPDAGAEISQAQMGIGMADMMLQGYGGFDAIKGVIGDELDIMLVEFPEGDMTSPDYDWEKTVGLLALSVDDPDKFKKDIGPMLGEAFKGSPVFTASGISFYQLEPGIVAGFGKGFFLVGTNPERLKAIIGASRPSIAPVTADCYVRIDVNTLWHKYLDPITECPDVPYPAYATKMHKEFWDITPETDFGVLEFSRHNKPNETSFTLDGKAELANLFGMAYTWILAMSASEGMQYSQPGTPGPPSAISTGEYNEESMQTLHEIQLAVERYGVDNEGYYPRYIDDLVSEGYLDSFPVNPITGYPMVARMPTDWAEGDFCYRPYIQDGAAVGYTLLLFGPDEHGGMDVVSPGNAFEDRLWQTQEDGNPDGVILILEGGPANMSGVEGEAS